MPLFYGGRLTSKGVLSGKSASGTQFKTLARIEKLVRLDNASSLGVPLTDIEIGRLLACSSFMVRIYRRKPEYLQLRAEVLTGLSFSADAATEVFVAARRQALKDMLPQALRVVADTLTNPLTNPVLKAKVALEVLDREGTFPKISRTDVHKTVTHDFADQDRVSEELLGYMDAPKQEVDPSILRALEANRKFANSETLSSKEQEAALASLEAMPPTTEKIQ